MGSTSMENLMGKENILGRMGSIMLVSLNLGKKMEKESGKVKKEIKFVIYMMVIMLMIRNKEKVYIHGRVEIYTKDNILMMKEMEMDKCYGLMAVFMKVNG